MVYYLQKCQLLFQPIFLLSIFKIQFAELTTSGNSTLKFNTRKIDEYRKDIAADILAHSGKYGIHFTIKNYLFDKILHNDIIFL